jgi:hypothetical protein
MIATRWWIALVVLASCKQGVSKTDFLAEFEPRVVEAFCQPQQIFRQCFDVDQAGCLALARTTVHACIEQHKGELPDHLDKEAGGKYGGILGECAGDAYEAQMRAQGKRHNDPKCDDPSQWTK